ncbi:MAG: hypothetical protein K6U00_12065, partial [Armatimonadetes bacterium]|nr:hypothetical protein [Armatimonadota bacterium]
MRFYEPGMGRFSQVDPATQGLCHYAYISNRPLRGVDPTGLRWGIGDWFDYYYRLSPGPDDAVDLGSQAVDLLGLLQRALDGQLRTFASQCGKKARSIARRACRCGDGGGMFAFSFADTFWPDMEGHPGLFPLGNTTVHMKAGCEVLV